MAIEKINKIIIDGLVIEPKQIIKTLEIKNDTPMGDNLIGLISETGDFTITMIYIASIMDCYNLTNKDLK